MLRPLFPLLTLGAACQLAAQTPTDLSPASPKKPAPPLSTIDFSRQIIVIGSSPQKRSDFTHSAARLRASVLASLNQPSARYPNARPILIVFNSSTPPISRPQAQLVEDPAGLKFQIDVSENHDPEGRPFQRSFIEALLLELALRGQNLAQPSPTSAPRWLIDALLHRFLAPNPFLAIESLRPLLDSGQIPKLEDLLTKLESDPRLSNSQDESIARCLLSLLANQPESKSGFLGLLQENSKSSSSELRLLAHFPSLGRNPADLQRAWTLHFATQGTLRERVLLDDLQTQRELQQLQEISLTDAAGNHKVFQLHQFSDYLRLPGVKETLAAKHLEFLAFQSRAHFFYSEAIQIYAEVCSKLASGRTNGQAAELRRASQITQSSASRLERIHDYLNWFEAEKSSARSPKIDEIYRIWDSMEPIPKNPFISRALDALEEKIRKQNEEADIQRALQESRSRSQKNENPKTSP